MTTTSDATLARARLLFLVAAVYDIALGVAFFLLYERIFKELAMPLPPHVSYITLPAVFVTVQGIGYLIVWWRPLANLGIVMVGAIYKASYAALALYYLVSDQIPAMFFAWFGLFDFLFLIGFVWFLVWARRRATSW